MWRTNFIPHSRIYWTDLFCSFFFTNRKFSWFTQNLCIFFFWNLRNLQQILSLSFFIVTACLWLNIIELYRINLCMHGFGLVLREWLITSFIYISLIGEHDRSYGQRLTTFYMRTRREKDLNILCLSFICVVGKQITLNYTKLDEPEIWSYK